MASMMIKATPAGLEVKNYAKPADVISWNENSGILVFKTQAESFNPGSRNSMLGRTYAGRQIFVVRVIGPHEFANGQSAEWFDAETITNYAASAKPQPAPNFAAAVAAS